MFLVFRNFGRVLSNGMKVATVLTVLVSPNTFASGNIVKFSGECSVGLKGQALVPVDSFDLEAQEGECPNKTIEFSVPGAEGTTAYGVYVEFQRSEFGPGLRDKPYFGVYEKSGGSVNNSAKVFNAKPDTVLIFEQELKDGARLYCSGTIQ